MTTMAHDDNANIICSQELLPILSHALPTIISYTLPSDRVVQANAEGARILARHSSTLSEKFDNDDSTTNTAPVAVGEQGGSSATADSRLLVTAQDGHRSSNNSIEETELFLKQVTASSYTHKSWTDMRRTLVYLRTEVRFYNEVVPLLLAPSDDDDVGDGNSNNDNNVLQRYLPKVHHADYNLHGLIPDDTPTTDAKQPSPFPEEGDEDDTAQTRDELLNDKGGHILLQSLSPSHGYFQDSPITMQQSLSCLTAVAELHASAWGNKPLLRTIHDRLSSAGGSYQLQFRNPKELQNMVASWESFRGHFLGHSEKTKVGILEKESVVRLGQRVYDMAEYVSRELTPLVGDQYATLVHGDYKAMNAFLPSKAKELDDDAAIMIDFSCAGIGYGMSDVGMHIVHAVVPTDLENGGEERLVDGYLSALEDAMNRKNYGKTANGEKWTYPREVAMRHYRLACVDYLRFIMGRFWRSATPDSFEKKKHSKNTTLINRNLDAAMAFIEKVDRYLEVFEKEKRDREFST
ncbi:hypothetical protein ACHAXR_008339 [Thalassiosira sp. AJA248-18]